MTPNINFKFAFSSTDPFTKTFSPELLRCYRSVLFIYKTPITNVHWDQFENNVRYYLSQEPFFLTDLKKVNLSEVNGEGEYMDMGNLNDSYDEEADEVHYYIVSCKLGLLLEDKRWVYGCASAFDSIFNCSVHTWCNHSILYSCLFDAQRLGDYFVLMYQISVAGTLPNQTTPAGVRRSC